MTSRVSSRCGVSTSAESTWSGIEEVKHWYRDPPPVRHGHCEKSHRCSSSAFSAFLLTSFGYRCKCYPKCSEVIAGYACVRLIEGASLGLGRSNLVRSAGALLIHHELVPLRVQYRRNCQWLVAFQDSDYAVLTSLGNRRNKRART